MRSASPGTADRHRVRFLSRIGTRLMLFNILLVFLPIAGILYLGVYEDRLVERRMRSLAEQAALLAASLGGQEWVDAIRARALLDRMLPAAEEPARLRVILPTGVLVADSRPRPMPDLSYDRREIREDWLYRVGSSLGRPLQRILRGDDPDLQDRDPYERSSVLRGPEISAALAGETAGSKRLASDQQSITLYAAAPIVGPRGVTGIVLASDTTAGILADLYIVRLGIIRIFLASVLAAIIVTLLIGMTIVRPLRRLREEAVEITERRGALARSFSGAAKQDEIGDLARALERVTARLDAHVRFLEAFATDVSHEFKNPLAAIRTATEMLAEVEDPRERSRFRRIIEQDIARMEHLLTGVREISTLDARLPAEERSLVDLYELAAKIVDGFRRRFGDRIRFELEGLPGQSAVEASEERLIQILENLLDNAVGFSSAGGTIRLTVRREGSHHLIVVADQGPGIPPEHLERIFDRFFTWRPNEKQKGAHTGLGLAISRAIAEAYGGSLRANASESEGAVFELRLPAAGTTE